MKLCDAFNRINRAFGANRLRLVALNTTLQFELNNFGLFMLMLIAGEVICVEWSEADHQFLSDTKSAEWLTAIANGLVRDDSGKMVPA